MKWGGREKKAPHLKAVVVDEDLGEPAGLPVVVDCRLERRNQNEKRGGGGANDEGRMSQLVRCSYLLTRCGPMLDGVTTVDQGASKNPLWTTACLPVSAW